MFKLLWRLISLAAVLMIVAYFVGWRAFVIAPMAPVTEGGVLIVSNMPELRLIDSPEAYCDRQTGSANIVCTGAIIARVSAAEIVWRGPYLGFLHGLSGAP